MLILSIYKIMNVFEDILNIVYNTLMMNVLFVMLVTNYLISMKSDIVLKLLTKIIAKFWTILTMMSCLVRLVKTILFLITLTLILLWVFVWNWIWLQIVNYMTIFFKKLSVLTDVLSVMILISYKMENVFRDKKLPQIVFNKV